MKSWKLAIALAVLSLLLAFALAAAQEPVRDFSQLNTRLRPGDTVWVTDAQGREVKGQILSLRSDALTLEGGGGRSFGAPDVTSIELRRNDSLGNGALIGLVAGGGLALVGCLASVEGSDRGWCAGAAAFYGGVGAGIGVGIDALINKAQVIYEKPARPRSPRSIHAQPAPPRCSGASRLFCPRDRKGHGSRCASEPQALGPLPVPRLCP
jgi:hypothetical protein